MATLFDKQGIQTSLEHNKMEQPFLDKNIVASECNRIAEAALRFVNRSYSERMSHAIDVPTWTGRSGRAGIPACALRDVEQTLKRKIPKDDNNCGEQQKPEQPESQSILAGLRKLTKALEGGVDGVGGVDVGSSSRIVVGEQQQPVSSNNSSSSMYATTAVSLHHNEIQLARRVMEYFFSLPNFTATTGQVIEEFGGKVPNYQKSVFKSLLQMVCRLDKSKVSNCPSVWVLRDAYRPPEPPSS
eukprot:GHVS01047210.1.p1 GENE.GHVS01047210.1~~GHVS01047210.1.p1  ORF type:complete len:260 (+),score=57.67 GHVS01047210.1:53-781(+)